MAYSEMSKDLRSNQRDRSAPHLNKFYVAPGNYAMGYYPVGDIDTLAG